MRKLFTFLLTANIIVSYAQPAKEWDKRFGGGLYEHLYSIQQTSDGGYILGGYSISNAGGDKTEDGRGMEDYWVVKTDADGIKQWDKTFGGSNQDFLYSVKQTKDGGFILGGYSLSNISGDKTEDSRGGVDYWVIKIDASGNKAWDKTYGGSYGDELMSVIQTSDGGYILGGYSSSDSSGDKTEENRGLYSVSYDYWIVKIDANGNKIWDKTFGGALSDYLHSVQQTNDGGYILGGFSYSGIGGDKTEDGRGQADYWIMKIDATGVKQWDKRFGGAGYDHLFSLEQTSDGGYILGGYSYSNAGLDKTENSRGDYDYWIIKTNNLGIKLWDKDFGGTYIDKLYSVRETKDGGFILGGGSYSKIGGDKTSKNKGGEDYWIIKTNNAGVKQWDADFGGNDWEEFYFADQTMDGGYILGGHSWSPISGDKTEENIGYNDYWIVKTKPEILPVTILSFTASLLQNKALLNWSTTDEINNDHFTIERSSNNKEFTALHTVPANSNPQNVNYYSCTDNDPLNGTSYYRLKQTDKDGKFTYSGVVTVTMNKNLALIIYPSPAKDYINIITSKSGTAAIKIYNAAGRQVINKMESVNSRQSTSVSLVSLVAGVYYVEVSMDGETVKQKFVKE